MTRIELPASPLSITLKVEHEPVPLFHLANIRRLPEMWRVRAEVDELELCADEDREVGLVEFALVDLNRDFDVFDGAVSGPGADVLDEVLAPGGRLVHEIDRRVPAYGPPKLILFRRGEITPAWRSAGLSVPLILGGASLLAPLARVAVYSSNGQEEALRLAGVPDGDRELAVAALHELLEQAGFWRWHRAHVAALHDADFRKRCAKVIEGWFNPQFFKEA
ncbi:MULTISPECIES: hypothetical protein [Amycolatopsis]|uniref:hypothetical protein n=1 Tax=Amycolatopsis TaxID=1813 RepID=UPI000B8A8185|nr:MULTISPECIES: hypothetical protein [Amycolatopsis]OXM70724.1 hypothetical protein CF166_20510 [Amycolatopsis sp. KNN50.9b]